MAKDPDEPDVVGGQFYVGDGRGPLRHVGDTSDSPPDVWICRRVADFPGARVPAGGAVGSCRKCAAPIVYNPARAVTAPKVCMQCARIVPLPIES